MQRQYQFLWWLKVAFVGENGAGKTTFIKLLTGMLQASKGDIYINGKDVKSIDYTEGYNSLSYVFQEPVRFNTFTDSYYSYP